MDSHVLGRQLLDGPRHDVKLSHFTTVVGVKLVPVYDGSAPYASNPVPAGHFLLLQPDGLAGGTGC